MTFDELKDKAHSLPLKPGVYLMQDRRGTIIYVGKAKVLRNRVSSYFVHSSSHTEKTRAMVSQIDHFDVIVADSEFEALVLESALIKRHQPHYNILLKDDKGYPYIRLTVNEAYPRFSLAGRVAEDGARYFGPYGSRGNTQNIIDAICGALKLPTCGRRFPRDVGKERPCLNHHMGRCAAWCRPDKTQEEYQQVMAQAIRLLEGRFTQVTAELETEMQQAAEELRFERAAELRDRIRSIELLSKRQKVVAAMGADTDVVGYYRGDAKSCFAVLHFVEGELADKEYEVLENSAEEQEEEISSLVRQYYESRGNLPRQILLPCEIEDEIPLARMLSERAGRKLLLLTPQRGAKADLIRLAEKNAREEVERVTTREERQNKLLELLGRMMGLDAPPRRMESYDISNTGASDIVASMVVYVDGKPSRKDYRHFKLKTLTGPDDYAAMEEVLTRRFRHELEGDERFGSRPDVLLIDGGVEHANVAVRVLNACGLSIPVFGMVKDDRHRTAGLVTPEGEEVGLRQVPAVFALIGQIQEETHRFAIEFHRKQRSKHSYASVLDEIPGVGKVRKTALLKQFKSVAKIRAASQAQLAEVVGKSAAQQVYAYFHKEDAPCE